SNGAECKRAELGENWVGSLGMNSRREWANTMQEPADDGLIVPEVGDWSRRTYYFLGRYLSAFNIAMRDKPWAGGRHYIDLFAGVGISRLRRSRELVWSSAMLAAQLEVPFTQLHLCDADPQRVSALRSRLAKVPQPIPPQFEEGDANKVASK